MTSVALTPLRRAPRRSQRPISIVSASTLHGCNLFHNGTLVCLRVDLEGWAGHSSTRLGEKFALRFSERFLGLPRLIAEPVRTIRFRDRLLAEDGAGAPTMAEVLLEAVVAVENAVAAMMHRLDTVDHATVNICGQVAELRWSSQSPSMSRLCASAAIAGINEILGAGPPRRVGASTRSFNDLFSELQRMAVSRRLTTTVSVIREAAKARGIPVAYVGGSYLRLGQGKYQTYFRGSVTGKTSHAASQMSIDKRLATKTLRLQRLPVPKHVTVRSAESAVDAARKFGLPIVIKPMKGHGGSGVSIVRDLSDVPAAFKIADKAGSGVLAEQFIEGKSYRLLVINRALVAALRIDLPEVTGDGRRSIAELVAELNLDPFRDGFRLIQIGLDVALGRHLRKLKMSIKTVLAPGQRLALRSVANVSQGGYAVDVTDDVHPDTAKVAVRAAQVIGLDVAGIDFLTPDISRSYKQVGGAIIEVNGRPGLGMHFWPRQGVQRDVGGAVVDMMFPAGSRSSIDSAVVVGDRRTAVVARDLDALLRAMDRNVGLAIRGRVCVNGERRESMGRKPARAIRVLLREPMVDCLVSTASPAGVLGRGLLLSRVDVAAVSAPSEAADMDSFRQAVDVVLKSDPTRLVIGADNPFVSYVVACLGASRVTLASRVGLTKAVRAHLLAGGHAVVARWIAGRRHVEIHEAGVMVASLPVVGGPLAEQAPVKDHETAASASGQRSQRIEPRLFAVALSVGLGQSVSSIAEALTHLPLSIK